MQIGRVPFAVAPRGPQMRAIARALPLRLSRCSPVTCARCFAVLPRTGACGTEIFIRSLFSLGRRADAGKTAERVGVDAKTTCDLHAFELLVLYQLENASLTDLQRARSLRNSKKQDFDGSRARVWIRQL